MSARPSSVATNIPKVSTRLTRPTSLNLPTTTWNASVVRPTPDTRQTKDEASRPSTLDGQGGPEEASRTPAGARAGCTTFPDREPHGGCAVRDRVRPALHRRGELPFRPTRSDAELFPNGPYDAIPKGAVVVYAGIMRFNHQKTDGRTISTPKHTFVHGTGRYVIDDLSFVKPVD